MKILFCTNAYEKVINGPAKFAHLLQLLPERFPEHQVHILTEDVGNMHDDTVHPVELNIPAILKPAGMFIRMFSYYREALRIKKNSFDWDILIFNNAIVSLRSACSKYKVIGFINDDNNASVSWSTLILPWKFSRQHIFFLTEWLATKWCSRIVVNSDYLKSYLEKRYKVEPGKIVRLYKGVELTAQSTKRYNAIPKILFVKNDYKRGGLFELIEALQLLPYPVELHVAGVPENAFKIIEDACNSTNIQLHQHGIITQEAVYSLMREADIFSVPSKKEALGVANIEAILMGCAVVTTQVGGIPEVMGNGTFATLVPPNNTKALADALDNNLQDKLSAENRTLTGQQYLQSFSLNNLLENFASILN